MENLEGLTLEEKERLLRVRKRIQLLEAKDTIKSNFLSFVKYVWPDFIEGSHHKKINDAFNRLSRGEIKRLIINMPPRHTKSEFASFLLPAWMIGKNPQLKIIQATHTADLAVDFGRKTKNLVDQENYKELFDTRLMEDSQAAGKWKTEQGGEYFAAGVGGAITGRGADLLIIDDPHKEQDIKKDSKSFEKAWNWYTSGPRQRLQPNGKIVCVMTRWSTKDLTGQMIKAQGEEGSDEWEVIRLPAILPSNTPVWPEYWTKEELEKTKASIPVTNWNAQYQQEPTAEEAALVKREWWQLWKKEYPPECEYVIMSLDAAAETHNRADYTALTTWGVFFNEEVDNYNIILLNSIKKRMEFPELKNMAMEEYTEWEPDSFIVEKKNSGVALYQEMRRMGLPIQEYTPHRGSGDKLARLNSVSDIVSSGLCWVPETRWAEEVIEEVAGFPFMSHDDLVDSTVMALMRFRQGGFIRLPSDEPEEVQYFKRRGSGYY